MSLREYVDRMLAEKDLRDQQRFDAQTKAVDTAMAAQQAATQAALHAADKAFASALLAAKEGVTKAETAADKRFDLLNELRVGVATRDQFEALEKVVNSVKDELTGLRGRTHGASASWGVMVAVGGLVLTLVGLAVAIVVAAQT